MRGEFRQTVLVVLVFALAGLALGSPMAAADEPCAGCREMIQKEIAELGAMGWWGTTVTSYQPGQYGVEVSGLLVMDVTPDGPADRAGLRERDVIVSIDGTELGSLGDTAIDRLLRRIRPGDRLQMKLNRRGRSVDASVLATRRSHEELARALGHRLLQRYGPAPKPQVLGDSPTSERPPG